MIAGLVGLFALGTLGFWILMVVVCGLLIATVEYEKPGWATVSVAAAFALLGWLGDFNVLTASREHPLLALGCVGAYLLLGTGYSLLKWWRFLRAKRADFLDAKAQFLDSRDADGASPDALLKAWDDSAEAKRLRAIPKARDHKSRILIWMMYWPWSGIWTLINDPIKKAFKAIYRELQAVYQKIADKTFADIQAEVRPPAPPPDPTQTRVANPDDLPGNRRTRGAGQ